MKKTGSLLELKEITMRFPQPSNTELVVLDDISLTVLNGQSIALVGPNGSGKTTLLRIVAGELEPCGGKIFFSNRNITFWPDYRRSRVMGHVHQESYKSLASELTVEELLTVASKRNRKLPLQFPVLDYPLAEISAISCMAADYVQSKKKMATQTLSGGQRQLLAIIVAVLGAPSLLLLDEHQASLDEDLKRTADELVNGFVQKKGGSFIAATHDKKWVDMNTDQVLKLADGKCVFSESPKAEKIG